VAITRSALRDPDSGVRAQALQTLAAVDTASARTAARAAYAGDPNNGVRAFAVSVIARIEGGAALPVLLDAARAGQPLNLRFNAAFGLARVHQPEAEAALEAMTAPAEDRNLRTFGMNMLAQQGDTARVVALATRYLDDPDAIFAADAVGMLARSGGGAARAQLLERFGRETRVRVKAAIGRVLHP